MKRERDANYRLTSSRLLSSLIHPDLVQTSVQFRLEPKRGAGLAAAAAAAAVVKQRLMTHHGDEMIVGSLLCLMCWKK